MTIPQRGGGGGNFTLALDLMDSQCKICMMTCVRMAPGGQVGVAAGVSMLGEPVSYATQDGGKTWHPSAMTAKGFSGAISGHDIELVMGSNGSNAKRAEDNVLTWAYVVEYNSDLPSAKPCTHAPISSQCSGYATSSDMGAHWTTTDWEGTDGADTDAMYGAFPSPRVHYISGGLVQAESEPGSQWKATVMKTTDGGASFRAVFNVTAPEADPGKGVGGMGDIECWDEETCLAVSSCYDDNCGDRYGSFVHRTLDGGKTWKTSGLFYESVMNDVQLVGESEVMIGGGGVGLFDKAVVWHSSDRGQTWTNASLSHAGQIMSLDVLADGSDGYATAVFAPGQSSTVYRMQR